ncbi:hypothetical protein [Legionella sainthelensi]|uniref:Uncharacterized protein n=1 Tax=Legionella sainthelensi TaxID=28087 RepID=A0A2H5FND9_9GAMM|nr:hypothetical protein [Legionella sainthelensi]AUH73079.1 hypothetical protein CAB17_14255 [Legionella sainthelensi]
MPSSDFKCSLKRAHGWHKLRQLDQHFLDIEEVVSLELMEFCIRIKLFMVKYIGLALIGISVSPVALALEKEKPCAFLCTNSIQNGFYAGVTGIYAKPGESGIGLVTHSLQYAIHGQITSKNDPFTPSNSGGIGAKVGYDFGNSANSLEFDYLHFNNTSFNVGGSDGDPYSVAAIFS